MEKEKEMKIKTKKIRQTVIIKASPDEVYSALTNPKKHSEFTGDKANGTDKLGPFSTFSGYAHGKNLKLIEGKKIVQTWTSEDFPKKHYSEATFDLKKDKKGTKLVFTQKNVPEDSYADVSKGWEDYYWKPLKKMLEK